MQNSPVQAEHVSLLEYLHEVLTSDQLAKPLLMNFNHWTTAQGALADIALTLHQHGSNVTIAFWGDKTPMLDVGWETSRALGSLFFSPTREKQIERALKVTGFSKSNFAQPPIKRWKPTEPIAMPVVTNRTSIREMTYRGAELGRAILQVNPDQNTPLTDEHLWPRNWVQSAAKSFAYVFDQTMALIQSRAISCVAVYNGRFLHDRAAAAAATALGLPVLSYDVGGTQTNYDLTIDDTHDWEALQRRMLKLYSTWDPKERDLIGSSWFLERTEHKDPSNSKFVESQEMGKSVDLPKNKKIVVFFSSSGDEISELDLDWADYFGSQENALNLVSRICSEDSDTFFIVRSHPHKRHKPTRDVSDWIAAVDKANPDLHLNPHSNVDSYALMRQADVVVTYGSTTGVEAAFAGKPVIVMGPSAYNSIGAAVQVFDEDDLRSAIELPHKAPQEGSISFGLLMKRRGFNFQSIRRHNETDFVIDKALVTDNAPIVGKLSYIYKRYRLRKLQK